MKKTIVLLSIFLLAAPLMAQAPPPAAKPAAPAQKQPTAAEKSLQEAIKLVQAGNAAAAVEKLKALEKDPTLTPPLRSLVGALYLQVNRPQEALALLQPLADAEDAEPAVLYNAGRAALLTGDVDAGKLYLTRSVVKQPASPAARDLGLLTAREGSVVEAYSMLRSSAPTPPPS